MDRRLFFQALIFYFIIQVTVAVPAKFRSTILKIQGLESNDLRGRQSRSSEIIPSAKPEARVSPNTIFINLLQRIASPGNFVLIRPSEPLSTNEDSLKWEKLGWGW